MPLAQAFCLYAAMTVRYGNVFRGPTYAERELLDAVRALPTTIQAATIEEAAQQLSARS